MPKPGPRITYKYSDKFKATAVKLSLIPGVQVKEVAESLCIHPFMLSKWRKEAEEGLIVTRGVELERDAAAELKELRKIKNDYERLKVEHELLKKAIEFTSSKGNCWDNAAMESFFARLKVECIYAEDIKSKDDAYRTVFEYIELFYNRIRRHSTNGYQSPENYEKQYYAAIALQRVYFSWVISAV